MPTSMTRALARAYIAGTYGASGQPGILDMAEQALLRGFNDWQNATSWEGALKDTSLTSSLVLGTLSNADKTITPATVGDYDFINLGVTLSGSLIPASTTVSSYTRNSSGQIATITVNNAITGSSGTVTVSAEIPIITGTQDYNVPSDFYRPHTAKLISNKQWALSFIRPRLWIKKGFDATTRGTVEAYTLYNTSSSNTQGNGTRRIRVYRIPSENDTLTLTYYRRLNQLSDPIDMPEEYLYQFLDYCAALLINRKKAQDDPAGYMKQASAGMQASMNADSENSEDEEIRLISQMEMGDMQRPLWSNGAFFPDYGG